MPTKQNNSQTRKPSTAALRDAIKQLGPPSRPLPARQQSNLQQLIARGARNAEIDAVLKRAGWRDPMPTHTMGGHPAFNVSRISLLTHLLDTLYLPVDDLAWYVPRSHRYISGQVWGHGVALNTNGYLRVNQYVDINQSSIQSTAGLYSQIFTTPADYGQVSQGTFEPEINWNAVGAIAINPPWGSNVWGGVAVIGRIWLAAYEFNIATSEFEEKIAVPHQLFNDYLNGLASMPIKYSGSFSVGTSPLKYILDPARTYWLGALIEVEVRQDFWAGQANNKKKPPAPSLADLTAYAVLTADVPAMWIEHTVLA